MNQISPNMNKNTGNGGTLAACGIPDNFPGSVLICAPDGRVAYASQRFLTQNNFDKTDILGNSVLGFLREDNSFIGPPAILLEKPLDDYAMVLLQPAGEERNVLVSADAWLEPDGQRYRILKITDITSLRTSQADLAVKSFRLSSCIEGTNAGTWEWNVQTGETRFNERWAEMVGYRLEDLEPVSIETWLNLAHPDDLKVSSEALERHFSGQAPYYDIESRMRHKDGREVWVRDRGRVFTWTADGKPEWMFGTHFLIDDEKRIDNDLKRANLMMERMSRMLDVGAWELDLETNQVTWSDETKRIHGVDLNYEPNVEDGIHFYAPEARPIITAAVEEGMKTGKGWDLELPFIRQNGERIWVRAFGEVEWENNKPRRIVGAFQDITQRVRDLNELKAAQEWTSFAASRGRVGLWSLDAVLGQLNWDAQMDCHFSFPVGAGPKTVADWLMSLQPESRATLKQAIRDSMFSGADMELELTHVAADGQEKILKLSGAAHSDQEGTVDRLQGACFDLTEERNLLARFEEQATRLSVTLSSIGDGVISTDETGHIIWMNPAAEKLTGWTKEQAIGCLSKNILPLTNQTTGQPVECPIQRCLKTRSMLTLEPDTILQRQDGSIIAIDDSVAPLIDSENRMKGAVMVFRDTTAERELSQEIKHRATHDPLTGLLNREAFCEQLEHCIADPIKQNGSHLFYVDLDHFKRINDSLGHDTGDAVLVRIASVLRSCAGQGAVIARLGGDEFAILLRAKNSKLAQDIGHQICKKAADGTLLKREDDSAIRTGVSVGIFSLSGEKTTAVEALRRADIAAYSAKSQGRGQACLWNEHDQNMQTMSRQSSLINLIEHAIDEGNWIVHEQCIQDIKEIGNDDTFVELLIRLPDRNGGIIPPLEFLPAAERYGLMQPIDLWMCSVALDRITRGLKTDARKIHAVNISASSIGSNVFQEDLLKMLSATSEATRKWLCLEVTETAILKNYKKVSQFLSAIRDLCVSVAIDDFGAGSTSFRHFQNLPADYLKIDGSFIQHLDRPVEAASVECFLRMAKVANLKTIAEHVERTEQIKALTALKVDFVQGFAIGQPHECSPH